MNNYGVKLDSLDDALIDIQQGKPIILMDNPGREGEGAGTRTKAGAKRRSAQTQVSVPCHKTYNIS